MKIIKYSSVGYNLFTKTFFLNKIKWIKGLTGFINKVLIVSNDQMTSKNEGGSWLKILLISIDFQKKESKL